MSVKWLQDSCGDVHLVANFPHQRQRERNIVHDLPIWSCYKTDNLNNHAQCCAPHVHLLRMVQSHNGPKNWTILTTVSGRNTNICQ